MKNLYPSIHKLLIKKASNDDLLKLISWLNQSVSNKIEFMIAEDIWLKSVDYVPKVDFQPPNNPMSSFN